ncbi:PAAR domain-containing protein, partial [Comamonas testosteroni]
MSVGHFICQGDKTSCGGEVLGVDQTTHMNGRLRACEGDPVTC